MSETEKEHSRLGNAFFASVSAITCAVIMWVVIFPFGTTPATSLFVAYLVFIAAILLGAYNSVLLFSKRHAETRSLAVVSTVIVAIAFTAFLIITRMAFDYSITMKAIAEQQEQQQLL